MKILEICAVAVAVAFGAGGLAVQGGPLLLNQAAEPILEGRVIPYRSCHADSFACGLEIADNILKELGNVGESCTRNSDAAPGLSHYYCSGSLLVLARVFEKAERPDDALETALMAQGLLADYLNKYGSGSFGRRVVGWTAMTHVASGNFFNASKSLESLEGKSLVDDVETKLPGWDTGVSVVIRSRVLLGDKAWASRALKVLQSAYRDDARPDRSHVELLNIAQAQIALQDFQAALETLEQARIAMRGNVLALRSAPRLVELQLDAGAMEKARSTAHDFYPAFQRASKEYGDDHDMRFGFAYALARLGLHQDAAAMIDEGERIIRVNNYRRDAYKIALTLAVNGSVHEALDEATSIEDPAERMAVLAYIAALLCKIELPGEWMHF